MRFSNVHTLDTCAPRMMRPAASARRLLSLGTGVPAPSCCCSSSPPAHENRERDMRSRWLRQLLVPCVVLVALAVANPARADHGHHGLGHPRVGVGFGLSVGYPAAYRAYDLRSFHSYPTFRSYYYPSYYPSYPLYP